jgi:hypothetical protein
MAAPSGQRALRGVGGHTFLAKQPKQPVPKIGGAIGEPPRQIGYSCDRAWPEFEETAK